MNAPVGTVVSIPFWVSTASRPSRAVGPKLRSISFNPVLGFYRVATLADADFSRVNEVFQSRSGFLPRRDPSFSSAFSQVSDRFNPVLGFYRVATHRFDARQGRAECVSIPFWVSTASRLGISRLMLPTRSCFNPVLGFYRVATRDEINLKTPGTVSIPFWVSTASRHRNYRMAGVEASFNPVLGFYRVATGGEFCTRGPITYAQSTRETQLIMDPRCTQIIKRSTNQPSRANRS